MEFLLPLAALALLAIPAIVLLYFLKVRRPEVRVSTLLFWRPYVADRQANAPWQRLRPSVLLFLQLLAALVLALGLMRPGLIGAAGVDSTTVVMIDASPTMGATDVSPSRFGAAVNQARSLAGQLAPGQQMAIILLGDHATLLAAPTGDSALLRSALDRAQPSGTAGDFAEGISLANSILLGRPGGSIIMLSDGHSQAPTSPPRVSAPFSYVSIGSTGENAAIQTMSPAGNGSVFLRLANYGRTARDMKVEMRADGRLVDARCRPVELAGEVTPIVRGGQQLALLSHRPGLLGEPVLAGEVAAAARLVLENERLQAEALSQLENLRASRRRIVQAGDAARWRLGRDLHDGAQQRLVTLALALRLAQTRLKPGPDPAVAERISEAGTELRAALADLRELAQGIFPAVLADEGLSAAVDALADEARIPLKIVAMPAERLTAFVVKLGWIRRRWVLCSVLGAVSRPSPRSGRPKVRNRSVLSNRRALLVSTSWASSAEFAK